MPAATGIGLRATSRTNRRRSVLNLSRPAHSSRRSAGVAIPRACFTPLGRGSGESRSGWRSGWRRWSTISTWTVPLSRRGQRWERRAAKPRRAFAAAAANPSIFATSARRCCCWEPISPPGPRRRRRRCAATGAEECSPPSAAGAEMGDVVALALGGDLAAVHQGVADHEVDQGRRDAQFLGDVLLWHAVQAVHLEGVAGALGSSVRASAMCSRVA